MKIILSIMLLLAVYAFHKKSGLSLGTTQQQLPSKPKKKFTTVKASASDTLYMIYYDNLYGYINQDGKVVIEPKYRSAGEFSEGLAAVRENGLYGYIDIYGNYVIPPRFHYAYEFHNGLARIQNDSVTYFINKAGRNLLPFKVKDADDFQQGLARVKTYSRKVGLIDTTGKLVADTVYGSISEFSEGLAIVTSPDHESITRDADFNTGAIDRTGKLVIPYGKYRFSSDFINGYASADVYGYDQDYGDDNAYVDRYGKQILRFSSKLHMDTEQFFEGLAKLTISTDTNDINSDDYCGYINISGKFVFKNRDWEYATNFTEGRAFVGSYWAWRLIDNNGKYVTDKVFAQIDDFGFVKGQAIVAENSGIWGVINKAGEHVIESKYQQLEYADEEKSLYLCKTWDRWGLVDMKGNVVAEPVYTDVAVSFNKGLLYVEKDSMYGYINKRGKLVWSEVKPFQNDSIRKLYAPDTLNIDFMTFSRYTVYTGAASKEGSGGWASSQNYEKPVYKGMPIRKRKLYVEISDSASLFADMYAGRRVKIVNTTRKRQTFEAQDSRIYLKLQAKDESGRWRDVEFYMNSWCGNSYHDLELRPNHYWNVDIPLFSGSLKTKLRVALRAGIDKHSYTLYSNEIDGSVNPAQFWRTQRYSPSSLMDPYVH